MKTKTYGPQFKTSKYEGDQINAIANRAVELAAKHAIGYDKMTALMDITACHCNGMELDLAKLMEADEATFGHDIFGIRRHIDRNTGKIGGCFVPRCAMPESTAATN